MSRESKKEIAKAEEKTFVKEEKTAYKNYVRSVEKEIGKIDKSYLTIAFNIYNVYANDLYEIDGYKNIYDFSADKFGFSRGTTNNYKNVVERFGLLVASDSPNPDEPIFDTTCVQLKPEYEAFGSSQLVLMLGMTDGQRQKITADMSVRKIKELLRIWNDTTDAIGSDDGEDNFNTDSETTGMNEPESSDIDIVDSNHIFICKAKDYNDIATFKDIIADSIKDVSVSRKGIKPMIEINIVW